MAGKKTDGAKKATSLSKSALINAVVEQTGDVSRKHVKAVLEAVAAVVVPRGDTSEDELIAHAREKLPHFKAPKRVFFVDELPRNASGKILKRELRDRFARP